MYDLTSANEKYKQLRNKYTRVSKKHIIALNRLAAIANLPGTQGLSPTQLHKYSKKGIQNSLSYLIAAK
jgi:hypothetical protein